jgi:hypothetical protein
MVERLNRVADKLSRPQTTASCGQSTFGYAELLSSETPSEEGFNPSRRELVTQFRSLGRPTTWSQWQLARLILLKIEEMTELRDMTRLEKYIEGYTSSDDSLDGIMFAIHVVGQRGDLNELIDSYLRDIRLSPDNLLRLRNTLWRKQVITFKFAMFEQLRFGAIGEARSPFDLTTEAMNLLGQRANQSLGLLLSLAVGEGGMPGYELPIGVDPELDTNLPGYADKYLLNSINISALFKEYVTRALQYHRLVPTLRLDVELKPFFYQLRQLLEQK